MNIHMIMVKIGITETLVNLLGVRLINKGQWFVPVCYFCGQKWAPLCWCGWSGIQNPPLILNPLWSKIVFVSPAFSTNGVRIFLLLFYLLDIYRNDRNLNVDSDLLGTSQKWQRWGETVMTDDEPWEEQDSNQTPDSRVINHCSSRSVCYILFKKSWVSGSLWLQ